MEESDRMNDDEQRLIIPNWQLLDEDEKEVITNFLDYKVSYEIWGLKSKDFS